jgi:hypothetical protein
MRAVARKGDDGKWAVVITGDDGSETIVDDGYIYEDDAIVFAEPINAAIPIIRELLTPTQAEPMPPVEPIETGIPAGLFDLSTEQIAILAEFAGECEIARSKGATLVWMAPELLGDLEEMVSARRIAKLRAAAAGDPNNVRAHDDAMECGA